ncbi:MAG: hypothetical protein ACKVX7_09270 [Planctomycetota bacterium]
MGRSVARILTLVFVLAAGGPALAVDQTIQMFTSAFLPQTVMIEVGDTVTWEWVAGSHVLTSGVPGGAPGTPSEPGALFSATIDASNPSFSYTFASYQPGGYNFFDALNPLQLGFVDVASDEETVIVVVLDNVFEPEVVHIFAGDSVRWEHEPGEMLHTVTSGLSSNPADDPGALFDEISSDSQPVFIYQFVASGAVPYFCRPHELDVMVGTIHVQSRFVRGDANRDALINIADAITTLSYLFSMGPATCLDAVDANDDGLLNLADAITVLTFVFTGGAPLPAPFPGAGPDRTADALFCDS